MAIQKKTKVKNFLARGLRRFGYDLRKYRVSHIEGFLGFDLFHDIQILMGDKPISIVDVGACDGLWVEQLSSYLPRGINLYVGFEPDSRVYEDLLLRVSSNKVIADYELHRIAIGNSIGIKSFNLMSSPSMNSFLEIGKDGWGEKLNAVEVEISKLDKEINQRGKWDVLKVDTQGYDFEVLKGANSLLKNHNFNFVSLEVNFAGIYSEIPDFPQLMKYMNARGYSIFGFYYPHIRKNTLAWCDVAFICSEFAASIPYKLSKN